MPIISEVTVMKRMLWDSIVDLQMELMKHVPQEGGNKMSKEKILYYLVNNSLLFEDLKDEFKAENARLNKKLEDLQALVGHHSDTRFNDIRIKYLMLMPEAVLLNHLKPSVLDQNSLSAFRNLWEGVQRRQDILDGMGELIDKNESGSHIEELISMLNDLSGIPSLDSSQISKWKELREKYERGDDAQRRKIEAIFFNE